MSTLRTRHFSFLLCVALLTACGGKPKQETTPTPPKMSLAVAAPPQQPAPPAALSDAQVKAQAEAAQKAAAEAKANALAKERKKAQLKAVAQKKFQQTYDAVTAEYNKQSEAFRKQTAASQEALDKDRKAEGVALAANLKAFDAAWVIRSKELNAEFSAALSKENDPQKKAALVKLNSDAWRHHDEARKIEFNKLVLCGAAWSAKTQALQAEYNRRLPADAMAVNARRKELTEALQAEFKRIDAAVDAE